MSPRELCSKVGHCIIVASAQRETRAELKAAHAIRCSCFCLFLWGGGGEVPSLWVGDGMCGIGLCCLFVSLFGWLIRRFVFVLFCFVPCCFVLCAVYGLGCSKGRYWAVKFYVSVWVYQEWDIHLQFQSTQFL